MEKYGKVIGLCYMLVFCWGRWGFGWFIVGVVGGVGVVGCFG